MTSPSLQVYSPRAGGHVFGQAFRAGKQPARKKELTFAEQAIESGRKLPLDFLFDRMHDTSLEMSERIDAAKAALPYVHRKMPQMHEIEITNPVTFEKVDLLALAKLSNDELDRFIELTQRVSESRAALAGEAEATEAEVTDVLPGPGATTP